MHTDTQCPVPTHGNKSKHIQHVNTHICAQGPHQKTGATTHSIHIYPGRRGGESTGLCLRLTIALEKESKKSEPFSLKIKDMLIFISAFAHLTVYPERPEEGILFPGGPQAVVSHLYRCGKPNSRCS